MPAEPLKTPKPTAESSGTAASSPQQAKKLAAEPAVSSWTAPGLDVSKFFDESRERLQEAFAQANGRFETLRTATVESGDVLKESQVAALAGIKELNEQIFELAHDNVDRGYDWLKACSEVKSLNELMQVQSSYLRESMEAQLDNARTLADLTANILKSTFAPMRSGMATVIENARKR